MIHDRRDDCPGGFAMRHFVHEDAWEVWLGTGWAEVCVIALGICDVLGMGAIAICIFNVTLMPVFVCSGPPKLSLTQTFGAGDH